MFSVNERSEAIRNPDNDAFVVVWRIIHWHNFTTKNCINRSWLAGSSYFPQPTLLKEEEDCLPPLSISATPTNIYK